VNFENGSLNPYAILGLPFGADFDLVKAIYKSMVKIYHPDIFVGDKKFAAQRLIELNAAFEFLSNPKKKKAYDASLNSNDTGADTDFTETDNSFDDETSSLMESWKFACEYHPEIQNFYNDLKKLNKRPAFAFMAILVEQKLYTDAKQIAMYLEAEFLTSAFGKKKTVRDIGKAALLANEKKYALELNHTLKKLGDSSAEKIISKLSLKYPGFGYDVLFQSNQYWFLIPENHPRKVSKKQKDKPFKNQDGPSKKQGDSGFITWIIAFLKVSLIFICCFLLTSVVGHVIGTVFQSEALANVLLLPLSVLFTYLINKKLGREKPSENWRKIDFLKVPLIFICCFFSTILAVSVIEVVFQIRGFSGFSFTFPLSILFTYLINKKLRDRAKKS
tara:strand:+ start:130 stop:1296 length:1167 start_codon:yes stop_codon:yes gene_type:complete